MGIDTLVGAAGTIAVACGVCGAAPGGRLSDQLVVGPDFEVELLIRGQPARLLSCLPT